MYYEERIINGVLHCRRSPDGEWSKCVSTEANVINDLMSMTEEGRLKVFSLFCTHCGIIQQPNKPRCTCQNDE